MGNHRIGVLCPVIAVGLGHAGIDRIIHPQEGAQHRAASLAERHCGRCADALIGAGHDRRVLTR